MIAVVQRVTKARVRVEGTLVGEIGSGMAVLVAGCRTDVDDDVKWMARKLVGLRIFRNGDKHFDFDVAQAGGKVLVVSNFTVAGATRQGRRPSFDAAAESQRGRELIDLLVAEIRGAGIVVEMGQFGADMKVEIVNDGPATFIVDSAERPRGNDG